ncbi:uncharacterized protein B0T15DRAFT_513703 [Chaetomium strumarium]|uniref:Uncharacterized protein n=1 Tax=Chaetomium strumarium TaxID=1170767 RepID=A0AAJ0LZL0_9PEZI|nr:hypothetical protein B0T15DRAFT_513703 [Chaetomium strumarium]
MSQAPCFPSGGGLPAAEPLRGPVLSSDSGQAPSAPHALPQKTPGRQRPERPLRSRLLQRLEASLAVDPDKEVILPVLVVGADLRQHALLARFSQLYELSLVTDAAVRFLGFEPLSLPAGVLKPFSCPLGRINPVRYVGLVVEQARNNLSQTTIGHVIVLDGRFNDRGPDLYLGRRFLQDVFDGGLPPKAAYAVGGAGQQSNLPNPMSLGQFGNPNPPSWTPVMPVGTAAQQFWGQTQMPSWPGQGGGSSSLSYAQPSEGFPVANQTSVLPAPQIPMAGNTGALLYYAQAAGGAYPYEFPQSTQTPEEQHAPGPGGQEMPLWNASNIVSNQLLFASPPPPPPPQDFDPSFGINGDREVY